MTNDPFKMYGYVRNKYGRKILLWDPSPEDYAAIETIADALAKMNRFNGGTRFPFSVARHSIIMSQQVPQPYKLEALLHDAHETVVGDIVTPMKLAVPQFYDIEKLHEVAMRKAYGLPKEKSEVIKEADLRMFLTEQKQLRYSQGENLSGLEPYDVVLEPSSWEDDENDFLNQYKELTNDATGDETRLRR